MSGYDLYCEISNDPYYIFYKFEDRLKERYQNYINSCELEDRGGGTFAGRSHISHYSSLIHKATNDFFSNYMSEEDLSIMVSIGIDWESFDKRWKTIMENLQKEYYNRESMEIRPKQKQIDDIKTKKTEIYREVYEKEVQKAGPGMRLYSNSIISHLIFAMEDSRRTKNINERAKEKAWQVADEWYDSMKEEIERIEQEKKEIYKRYEHIKRDIYYPKMEEILKLCNEEVFEKVLDYFEVNISRYMSKFDEEESNRILDKQYLTEEDIYESIMKYPFNGKIFIAAAKQGLEDCFMEYYRYADERAKIYVRREIVSFLTEIYENGKNNDDGELVNEQNRLVIQAAKKLSTWNSIAKSVYGDKYELI